MLSGCLLLQVKLIQAPKSINRQAPAPSAPSLSDRLSAWLQESNASATLGGDLQLLKWLARCLLTIGGRSIGHLYSYLDRHEPIMNGLVAGTGDQVGHIRVHLQPSCHKIRLPLLPDTVSTGLVPGSYDLPCAVSLLPPAMAILKQAIILQIAMSFVIFCPMCVLSGASCSMCSMQP